MMNPSDRNLKTRFWVMLIKSMAGPMVFPFLTLYFAKQEGPAQAALLLFLAHSIGIGASMGMGHISQWLRLKTLIVWAEGLRSLSFFALALSLAAMDSLSIWLWWPLFTLIQVTTVASIPATEQIVALSSVSKLRKKIYSSLEWAQAVSFALGALIGALGYTSFFSGLVALAGMSALGAFVMSLIGYTEPEQHRTSQKMPLRTYGHVLQDRRFLFLFISTLILFSVENQLGGFVHFRLSQQFEHLPLKILSFQFSIEGHQVFGILKTLNLVAIVILAPLFQRYHQLVSDLSLSVIGLACFGLGYGIVSQSLNLFTLIIGIIIASLGEVIVIPLTKAFASHWSEGHQQLHYLSIFGLNKRMGMAFGAAGLSFATWPSTATLIFLIVSILSAFGLLIVAQGSTNFVKGVSRQ